MADSVLEIQSVSKAYGRLRAVSGLDLRVDRGALYALVGQNGAGKTTLLKLICGLAPADSGTIVLFGESSPRGLRRMRARTGAMIESPAFLPYLTAGENLDYLRIQRGEKDRSLVPAALQYVGLSGAGRKRYGSFSLGMKQRLGLALALMAGADLLLLDEPINGLDPVGIREFREILLRMNRERGTTVLISSHILGELSQVATEYGFMDQGRLLQHITAAELREKCRGALLIDTDDPARALALLRDKLGCARCSCSGRTLRIPLQGEDPAVFIQALTAGGAAVSQIRQAEISLEEYFIRLVNGGQANV